MKNDKRRIREKSAFVVTENVLYHKAYKGKVQRVVKQVEVHDLWLKEHLSLIL